VDAVYVSDSNHLLPPGPRRLHALDAATGQPLWTYEVDSTLLTTPALGPGAIYVTITGAVIALE
jgi:outer membrane protein assembly factor BamB